MSEHLEPLVAAYVAQRQRAFHQSTRGIPTPENRAAWELDASEKIRAHDREVKAEAWDEGHSWGWSDAQEAHDVRQEMDRSEWRLSMPNPYRIESEARP